MRKTEQPDRRNNAAPVRNTNRERRSSTGRRTTGERYSSASAKNASEEKIDSFQIIDLRQKRAEEQAEEERQRALERAEAERKAEELKKRSAEIEALKLRRKAQRAQEAAKAHAAREEAARAEAKAREEAARAAAKAREEASRASEKAREEAARANAKARTEAKARALKAAQAEKANRDQLNARVEAVSRTAKEVRAAAGSTAAGSAAAGSAASGSTTAGGTVAGGTTANSGSSSALNRTLESSRNFSSVHSAARKIRTESGVTKRTAPKAVIPGMDAFLAELEAAKKREAEEARQREIERARQQELEKARQREQEAARIREEEARKRREAEEERIRALEEQKRLEEERQRYLEQEAARKREEAEKLREQEAQRRREAEAERIRESRIARIREAEAARVHQEEQVQLGEEIRKLKEEEGQEFTIEAGLEAVAERYSAEAEILLEEEREKIAADLQEELTATLQAELAVDSIDAEAEYDAVAEPEADAEEAEAVADADSDDIFDAEKAEAEEEEADADIDDIFDEEAHAEETDAADAIFDSDEEYDSADDDDDDDYDDYDYDFPFGRPDSDLTERVDPQDQAGTVKKQSEDNREKKLFNRKLFDAMLGKIIAALLIFFMVFNLVLPDKDKSVIENRELKQMPKLSAGSLADGTFTGSFESWQSDQFAGRNLLRNVQIFLRWLGGDRLENDVYQGKNGQLLEKIVKPDETLLQGNIAALNAFAEAHPDRTVRMMLVPDAGTILPDQYPAFAEKGDQRADYERVKGLLSDHFEWIDVTGVLESHTEEKLYYKTDHHWTSRGAQIAYEKYCEQAGLEPGNFEEKAVSNTFNGSLSSTSGFCMGEKESIEIYLPENGPDFLVSYVDEQVKTATLYDAEKLDTKDQYALFLGGNHSVVDIHTTLDNGRVLLVFKDSFANSMLPFLTTQYSEIVVCDPRYYYGDAAELMNTYPVTDVLFLYSGNTFFADNNLQGVLGA